MSGMFFETHCSQSKYNRIRQCSNNSEISTVYVFAPPDALDLRGLISKGGGGVKEG